MKKYKHIVFDVDGTLLDSEMSTIIALQSALRELRNEEASYEKLAFTYGIPGVVGLSRLGFDKPEEALLVWNKYIFENKWMIDWFKGTKEVLVELKKQGYALGVVTSRNAIELEMDASRYGFNEFFDIFIKSDDTSRHKPYGDPLLKYLEVAGISPKEALYIGDTEYDYLCSKAANVDFIHAKWGSHVNLDDVAIANAPSELLEIIGGK